MKKVKNKRGFAVGVIATILAGVCLGAIFFTTDKRRFLLAGILLLLFAIGNYFAAFSKKGILEEVENGVDLGGRRIIKKSSHMALRILNYVLCTGCFISLIMYAVVKSVICIAVAITCCAVLIMLFVVLFGTNAYCEKHNLRNEPRTLEKLTLFSLGAVAQ